MFLEQKLMQILASYQLSRFQMTGLIEVFFGVWNLLFLAFFGWGTLVNIFWVSWFKEGFFLVFKTNWACRVLPFQWILISSRTSREQESEAPLLIAECVASDSEILQYTHLHWYHRCWSGHMNHSQSKSRFSDVFKSFKVRNSISSSHPLQYPNSKAPRVSLLHSAIKDNTSRSLLLLSVLVRSSNPNLLITDVNCNVWRKKSPMVKKNEWESNQMRTNV